MVSNEERDYVIGEVAFHVKKIMEVLNIKMTHSTSQTPLRVARMYTNEVFKNQNTPLEDLSKQMTYFDNKDSSNNSLVIVKDIPFYSTCEHHLMPFYGKITVAYIPNKKLIGLSKIPRVVKFFSKKAQLQENLVTEIADFLQAELDTNTLFVLARDCVHTCVTARGIETYCETDTLIKRGVSADYNLNEFLVRVGK